VRGGGECEKEGPAPFIIGKERENFSLAFSAFPDQLTVSSGGEGLALCLFLLGSSYRMQPQGGLGGGGGGGRGEAFAPYGVRTA